MSYTWTDMIEDLYDNFEQYYAPDNDDDSEDLDTTEDPDVDDIEEYEEQLNDELDREAAREINRR